MHLIILIIHHIFYVFCYFIKEEEKLLSYF